MENLIQILEALREQTMMENKELLEIERRKGPSYFEGKIAGIELALEKARMFIRNKKERR